MNLNGDGRTDLLWYNAKTGRAVYSIAAEIPGAQVVVRDLSVAKGWTSLVPMNLNGDGLSDLLSYNKNTGRAVYSIGANPPGSQVIVRDLNASPGWTSVVPMLINGGDVTDLLSYNASDRPGGLLDHHRCSGLSISFSGTCLPPQGWTSVVPMKLNAGTETDLLSYNATTGRAVYSIGANPLGTQKIVRDLIASKGWTSVVPMRLNGDGLTDLLSYNKNTGRAVYSVTAEP